MNYLAHMYLSGTDDHLMIGNFIADAVKGKRIEWFSEGIRKGIRLHRAIDTYTDSHYIVAQSRERLHSHFHKYSGVVVDMYFDHFLALRWDRYSQEDLHTFVHKNYRILIAHFAILPSRTRRILPYIIGQDWLVSYADLEKLQHAFKGMARRTRFESGMETAVDALVSGYDDFEEEFHAFFPELIAHTQSLLLQGFTEAQ